MSIRPWARGPFELIIHGELHYRAGEDFDRRVALISFDNAIEVAIGTYLGLHPLNRGNREYEKKAVAGWLQNFHTKLEFWESECERRSVQPSFERADLVFYHAQRSDQYHTGRLSAPDTDVLRDLRSAAIWIFAFLFEVDDIDAEIEDHLLAFLPPQEELEPDPDFDRVLDEFYGEVELAGGIYSTSELLFRTDPEAYKERALELLDAATSPLRVVS